MSEKEIMEAIEQYLREIKENALLLARPGEHVSSVAERTLQEGYAGFYGYSETGVEIPKLTLDGENRKQCGK